MNPGARYVITNAALAAIAGAAWWAGLLGGFGALGRAEIIMASALGVLFLIGQFAAFRRDWDTVSHVANILPKWGLALTGTGVLLVASQIQDLSQASLFLVFKGVIFAIAPNVTAAMGMAWLQSLSWWSAREET